MKTRISDCIPGTLRDRITASYGESGLKGLARDMGLPYMTLVNIFKRATHKHLVAFLACSDELGIKAQDLLVILEVDPAHRRTWLKGRLGRSCETVKELVQGEEASAYLYSLLAGKSGRQVKSIYAPLAKKFSLSIEELYQILIASQSQAA